MQCMLFGHSAEHKQDLLGMATQGSVGAGLTEAGLITPEVAVQTEAFKKSRATAHGPVPDSSSRAHRINAPARFEYL